MMKCVVDLHAHLLHGLDDGPATLEESLAMTRMAAHAGTKVIAAAVHASRAWPFQPALAQRRWEELQHLTRDLIRIVRACEVELHGQTVEQALARPERYSIGGTRYLLAEAPEGAAAEDVERQLFRLLDGGLRPILVHPELHPEIVRRRRRLARWVSRGVLLQLGAGSLTGAFGSRAAAASAGLLKRGLAHFIGSGGHDLKGRPPRLDAVRLLLFGQYPPEFVEQVLGGHPQAVIEDREIEPGPLRAPYLKRHWLPF